MSADMWLLIRSLAAGLALVLVVGSWLLDNGHRLRVIARWRPVRRQRRDAAREAALCVSHFSDESHSLDGDRQRVNGRLLGDKVACLDNREAGSTPAGSLTKLVPFSRAEKGYCWQFKQGGR